MLFTARVDKKKSKLPVVLPDGTAGMRPTSLSCKGEITLVESVEVPEVGTIQVPPFEVVKQPDSFVRRHPFYGIVPEAGLVEAEVKVEVKEEDDNDGVVVKTKSSEKKAKKKKKKSKSEDKTEID